MCVCTFISHAHTFTLHQIIFFLSLYIYIVCQILCEIPDMKSNKRRRANVCVYCKHNRDMKYLSIYNVYIVALIAYEVTTSTKLTECRCEWRPNSIVGLRWKKCRKQNIDRYHGMSVQGSYNDSLLKNRSNKW